MKLCNLMHGETSLRKNNDKSAIVSFKLYQIIQKRANARYPTIHRKESLDFIFSLQSKRGSKAKCVETWASKN